MKNKRQREDDFSFAELEEGLLIDKNALDEALVQQPDLFYRVAERLAITISKRDAAKTKLEQVEAETTTTYNEERDKEKKLTVSAIKALVIGDPDVMSATKDLQQLSEMAMKLQALRDAYQQRSYALGQLVDLHIAGYFGPRTRGSSDARERQAEEAREELSKKRRTRL